LKQLSETKTFSLFERFLSPDPSLITDLEIKDYLISTSNRTISAEELIGAAKSLRKHFIPVKTSFDFSKQLLLDTCGTGGSGYDTFNTSTVVAFIAAGAGQPVAKHGNRAASSKCGSADLISTLGISLELSPCELADCLKSNNFCFMFAPNHHPATKRVQILRKELKIRTIFNFLGPLLNPAGANTQLLGVSDPKMHSVMTEALLALGTKKALVVCSEEGLDEISLSAETNVLEINLNSINTFKISPEAFGLTRTPLSLTPGFCAEDSAKKTVELLRGQKNPYRDLVLLNAAAALYLCEKAVSIESGIEIAKESLDSGAALNVLNNVVEFSNACKS
jgi:anthranilate phosphoribosyltransferase